MYSTSQAAPASDVEGGGEGSTAVDLPADLFARCRSWRIRGIPPSGRARCVLNLPEGLKIRSRASKEMFRPGEEMTVEVRGSRQERQADPGGAGLSVVDEALVRPRRVEDREREGLLSLGATS